MKYLIICLSCSLLLLTGCQAEPSAPSSAVEMEQSSSLDVLEGSSAPEEASAPSEPDVTPVPEVSSVPEAPTPQPAPAPVPEPAIPQTNEGDEEEIEVENLAWPMRNYLYLNLEPDEYGGLDTNKVDTLYVWVTDPQQRRHIESLLDSYTGEERDSVQVVYLDAAWTCEEIDQFSKDFMETQNSDMYYLVAQKRNNRLEIHLSPSLEEAAMPVIEELREKYGVGEEQTPVFFSKQDSHNVDT